MLAAGEHALQEFLRQGRQRRLGRARSAGRQTKFRRGRRIQHEAFAAVLLQHSQRGGDQPLNVERLRRHFTARKQEEQEEQEEK